MNYLKCSFKSDLKNVSLARSIASCFYAIMDPTIGYLNEVKTIVSEAVTNAIIHGYENDDCKEVEMNLQYTDTGITIEVIDYGIGISDIEQAKKPMFSTKADDERSGLGFTIMEVFSDQLSIESDSGVMTKVTVKKRWEID